MRSILTVRGCAAAILALFGFVPGVMCASDAPLAEIQNISASTISSSDPEVAMYRVKFDLRLINKLNEPTTFPKPQQGDSGTTRVQMIGVQAKRMDGSWANVIQSSWYGTGNEKYDACVSVSPGEATQTESVSSGIALLREQLKEFGSEPTLRLSLMIFCRKSDGMVLTTIVPSGPVILKLPQ